MTNEQKKCIRKLLDLSYEHGFNLFPLTWLSKEVHISVEQLYDANTETGILWPFDPRSGNHLAGYLQFNNCQHGYAVGITRECREDLEHWSDY